MQHVNIKILASAGPSVNVADAIPVFHRWIQKRALPETLIDVADYTHVPQGPGVLLIAHEANYSLDCGRDQLGLLYNRKTKADEDGPTQLKHAYESALQACRRLESEAEFQGKLKFDPNQVELVFNDRLLHPNTDEGWKAVEPDARQFLDLLFGAGKYALERFGEPRERLQASARRVA